MTCKVQRNTQVTSWHVNFSRAYSFHLTHNLQQQGTAYSRGIDVYDTTEII